jgi:hypothetical protein
MSEFMRGHSLAVIGLLHEASSQRLPCVAVELFHLFTLVDSTYHEVVMIMSF